MSELLKDKNDLKSVKKFAHETCGDYLTGAWKSIKEEDMSISRLSGGLNNYLYKCEINAGKFKQENDEPRVCLLRVYGDFMKTDKKLLAADILHTTIISERKIGPKIYGIFDEGRLEEFFQGSCLKQDAYYDLETNATIGKLLADFHMLEMPSTKRIDFLEGMMREWLKDVKAVKFSDEKKVKQLETFHSYNFEEEWEKIKKEIEKSQSPCLFCHNDCTVGNTMNTDRGLVLIDYGYSCYNFRGHEFGIHFSEHVFDNNHSEWPYFQYDFNKWPDTDRLLNFIRSYIKQFQENVAKTGKKNHPGLKNLDEKSILNEIHLFSIASQLNAAVWAVCHAIEKDDEFGYMDYAMARADAYFKLKAKFYPQGYGSA